MYIASETLQARALNNSTAPLARRTFELVHGTEDVEAVVMVLLRFIAAKDKSIEQHLYRVAHYAIKVGQLLELPSDDIDSLWYGALLHDIGKLHLPDALLRKAGPLTHQEYRVIQMHPTDGVHFVRTLAIADAVTPIIRHHHEHWNGAGYPVGLSGTEIPLGARIVAVVDAFDAMTTQRPYNVPLRWKAACDLLEAGAGLQWDPQIVALFVRWIGSQSFFDGALEREYGSELVYA